MQKKDVANGEEYVTTRAVDPIIYTREFFNQRKTMICIIIVFNDISQKRRKALWGGFMDRVDHDGVLKKMLSSEEIFVAFLQSPFDAFQGSAVFEHPYWEQAVMIVSAR